jgi:hypothetical protein
MVGSGRFLLMLVRKNLAANPFAIFCLNKNNANTLELLIC